MNHLSEASTLWGKAHTDLPSEQLHGPLEQLVCILCTLLPSCARQCVKRSLSYYRHACRSLSAGATWMSYVSLHVLLYARNLLDMSTS